MLYVVLVPAGRQASVQVGLESIQAAAFQRCGPSVLLNSKSRTDPAGMLFSSDETHLQDPQLLEELGLHHVCFDVSQR